MNKYIESNSKKFLIMLLLICVVFLVVIIKAFEYIPVSDDDAVISRNNIENINKPAQNSEDTASDESTEENEEKKTLDINLTPDFVEKQKTEAPKEEKVAEPLENITDLPNDAVTANSSEESPTKFFCTVPKILVMASFPSARSRNIYSCPGL